MKTLSNYHVGDDSELAFIIIMKNPSIYIQEGLSEW